MMNDTLRRFGMRRSLWQRGAQMLAALTALTAIGISITPTQAAPFDGRRTQFADEAFRTVWSRTDAESVRGGRTWYWGPGPWFDYAEFNRQSPNGLRTVQYFDKARMEINNPADRSFQGGVTNGLLVVEMTSGRIKLGDDPFDTMAHKPADVPVAGNPKESNPNSPTYASFASVSTLNNNYRDPNKLGQRVSQAIDLHGNVSNRNDLANNHPETEIVQFNSITGHNIPKVFWDFLNLQGPYIEGGSTRQGTVVDWVFAMGLPISDAYWTRAKVGNEEKDVLVQLFERRVLTYTPSNPAGYKVEMGNVGQHYFQWRYPHLGQPWASSDPNLSPIFATDVDDNLHWELNLIDFNAGNAQTRITNGKHYTVAYSYKRSWSLPNTRILADSARGDGQHRQIYELNVPAVYDRSQGTAANTAQRLTYTDGTPPPESKFQTWLPNGPANDYNPSISPDGTKIAFISDRDGKPQLYLMYADGSNTIRLHFSDCIEQVPSWSPDGRKLYWERQCADEKFKIMSADLHYTGEGEYGLQATLVNITELTTQEQGDNRFPRVSPDGSKIVFTSYRDGNAEIYTMSANGGNQTRLTYSAGEDEAASWTANGTQLMFASNRDGNYEIYTMNADGSNQVRRTNSNQQDRWVLWAQ